MAEKKEIEIYIAMNEDGDWAVDKEPGEASETLSYNSGGACIGFAKIKVRMTPPAIVEATAEVADEQIEVEAAQ